MSPLNWALTEQGQCAKYAIWNWLIAGPFCLESLAPLLSLMFLHKTVWLGPQQVRSTLSAYLDILFQCSSPCFSDFMDVHRNLANWLTVAIKVKSFLFLDHGSVIQQSLTIFPFTLYLIYPLWWRCDYGLGCCFVVKKILWKGVFMLTEHKLKVWCDVVSTACLM